MAGKDIDEQVPLVLAEMMRTISDVRVAMDLMEAEVDMWQKKGIECCDSHTGEDLMLHMGIAQNQVGCLGMMFQLLAHYHVYKAHKGELNSGIEALFFGMQLGKYERFFEAYQESRRLQDAESAASTPPDPDAKPAEDWLDRIFGKRGNPNGN